MIAWYVRVARATESGRCLRCAGEHPGQACPRWAVEWAARCARARAADVCVRCGNESAALRCRTCTIDHSEDKADRRIARQVRGLCRCGQAPRPGRDQCERCDRQNRKAKPGAPCK